VRSGVQPIYANRLTSDGDIAVFAKDGTSVGSWQSRSGAVSAIILDPRTGGRGLSAGTNSIVPTDKDGTLSNGATDIGEQNFKFRDLYLSGGAYLGGTAAANQLDDYEEGTWRPTVAGATSAGSYTYGENAGVYTKIGNQVTCSFYILQLGANTDGSGALIINNLPFTVASITAGTVLDYFTGNVTFENFDIHTSAVNLASHAIAGTTHITFFETKDASLDGTVVTTDRVDGNADIIGQITYRTT
jgi:hypothetical protein